MLHILQIVLFVILPLLQTAKFLYEQANSFGTMLAQSVMKDLNLLEADYFGIVYKDKQGVESFLDPLKKLKVQIPSTNLLQKRNFLRIISNANDVYFMLSMPLKIIAYVFLRHEQRGAQIRRQVLSA